MGEEGDEGDEGDGKEGDGEAAELGGGGSEGDWRVMSMSMVEMGETRGMGGSGESDEVCMRAIVANGRLLVDGAETLLAAFDMRAQSRTPAPSAAGEETTWFDSRRNSIRRDGMRPFFPIWMRGKLICGRWKRGERDAGAGACAGTGTGAGSGSGMDMGVGMGWSGWEWKESRCSAGAMGSGNKGGTGTREGGPRTCAFVPQSFVPPARDDALFHWGPGVGMDAQSPEDMFRWCVACSVLGGSGGNAPVLRSGMCASGSPAYECMKRCCMSGPFGKRRRSLWRR